MNDLRTMSVVKRVDFGKVLSAKLRQEGFVPSVIYSCCAENVHIQAKLSDVVDLLSDYKVMTRLINLALGNESISVIVKDVTFHPVTDLPIHVDFMRVRDGEEICVDAPVKVVNKSESVGVKRGGEVFLIKYNVPLKIKASSESVEALVDVAGSVIGQKFYLSHCKIPLGSSMLKDVLVAKIVGKRTSVTNTESGSDESPEGAGLAKGKVVAPK